MSRKKKVLHVSVSVADYAHYEQEAQFAGMSLNEWAQRKLALPIRPEPVVIEAAFRDLDVSDAMRDLSGTPPPMPTRPVMPLPVLNLERAGTVDQHSCLHFARLGRTDGGAPNVCTSTAQYGKPCYWPAAGAKDCLHFSPRGPGRK